MSSDPEVEHRAKQARFEKAEQLYQKVGNVSAIKFSSAFQQRKLRLIEVPTEVLTNVQAGESLSIIGEDTTEVVLCSKDKTYSIKKVETSNSGQYFLFRYSSTFLFFLILCSCRRFPPLTI